MEHTIKKDEKCQKISVSLIARRNIIKTVGRSSDDMATQLLELSHVRLDREKISEIDNLDCLGPVTHLYLQKNQITRIENLEVLPKLKFLTLADNKITKVENLKILSKLQFLDLSDNLVEDFDGEEFPASLVILNLKGNPCTQLVDYKKKLFVVLPLLKQLDGQDITREERLQAGCAAVESDSDEESDDQEEEEEKDISVESKQGSLHQHCNDILVRAKIRTLKEEHEHKKRMEELANIRKLHSQELSSKISSRH